MGCGLLIRLNKGPVYSVADRDDETASAWNPKGSNLQVEIAVNSKSGPPTFRKSQFLW
jgi:hypothetical protein